MKIHYSVRIHFGTTAFGSGVVLSTKEVRSLRRGEVGNKQPSPSLPLKLLKNLSVCFFGTPPGGKLVRQKWVWDPTRRRNPSAKRGCGTRPRPKLVRGEGARSRTPGGKYRRRCTQRSQRNCRGALDLGNAIPAYPEFGNSVELKVISGKSDVNQRVFGF